MHFDEVHHYHKKDLKSQEFVDDEWQKEDNKLFADPTDVMDASEPTFKFNIILCKTYPYSDELHGSSSLSDISDLVGDEEYNKENDAISDNEESYLQLNKGDKNSGIQFLDVTPKQSRQNHLIRRIPSTWQSAWLKDKTPLSTNIICSISASLFDPKSHIYMVTVLDNLNAGCYNSSLDKPLSLKEVMRSPY